MPKRTVIFKILIILALVAAMNVSSAACSLAPGYFHQVTAIRGRVVGHNWGFRWFRQSFSVGDATLTLYEYRFPIPGEDLHKISDLKMVATVRTDSHGNFDFGSISKGHYSLEISVKNSDRMGGLFDVEITDKVKATDSVVIDVSPIHPDCTDGHEFIEKKL